MGIYDRPYYQDEQRGGFSFSGRSMVTNLIIVNVVIYVIDAFFFSKRPSPFELAPLSDFARLLALDGQTLLKPWLWWKLVTYGFCHDANNFGHLLGNMLGLFFLGQSVEQHYGPRSFLRMYLTALVFCGVIWSGTQLALGDPTRLIGASGAVTTVIILFALNFPRRTILFMMFIPMPAWVFGVMIVAFNIVGTQKAPGVDNTAYDVHLAGAVYAWIYFKTHWAIGLPWGWKLPTFRMPSRRPSLKIHHPDAKSSALDEQADAVLDKLHREGLESLSARERKVLEEYSRRMKQKHQ